MSRLATIAYSIAMISRRITKSGPRSVGCHSRRESTMWANDSGTQWTLSRSIRVFSEDRQALSSISHLATSFKQSMGSRRVTRSTDLPRHKETSQSPANVEWRAHPRPSSHAYGGLESGGFPALQCADHDR